MALRRGLTFGEVDERGLTKFHNFLDIARQHLLRNKIAEVQQKRDMQERQGVESTLNEFGTQYQAEPSKDNLYRLTVQARRKLARYPKYGKAAADDLAENVDMYAKLYPVQKPEAGEFERAVVDRGGKPAVEDIDGKKAFRYEVVDRGTRKVIGTRFKPISEGFTFEQRKELTGFGGRQGRIDQLWKEYDQSVNDVDKILETYGVDEETAKSMAKEIQKDKELDAAVKGNVGPTAAALLEMRLKEDPSLKRKFDIVKQYNKASSTVNARERTLRRFGAKDADFIFKGKPEQKPAPAGLQPPDEKLDKAAQDIVSKFPETTPDAVAELKRVAESLGINPMELAKRVGSYRKKGKPSGTKPRYRFTE